MEVLCSVYRFPAPCARSVMGLFSSRGHFCGIRPSLLPRQRLQCVSHLPPMGSWLRPPFPRPSFCLQRGFSRCGGCMQSSWLVPRVGRRGALNQKGRGKPLGGGWRKASGSWLCSVTLAKAFPRSFCFPSALSQWHPLRLCISAPHCQALLPPPSPRLRQGCLAFAVPSSALGPPLPFLERRG